MNEVIVAGSGLVGCLAGVAVPVVVARVPERVPLRRAPFPEARAARSTLRGGLTVVATGALLAGTAARIGASADLPAFLLLAVALVVLSLIDLERLLLPNRIVGPVTVACLALFGIAALIEDAGGALLRALAAAVITFLVFTVLHLFSPRSMGFGDVKLSFVLGLALGWLGAGEAVLGPLLAFVYGAVVGVALLVTRVRGRRDHIPFGPFLAAGALTAVLVGHTIIDWYRG